MKIFLTNPIGYPDYKIVLPPSGILAVASSLKSQGYDVVLYDAYLKRPTEEEFKQILTDFKPDVFGVGFNVEDRFAGFRTAQLAKQACPQAKIIAGGPFPNLLHQEVLKEHQYFDVIVRGEGDITIIELIEAFEGKRLIKDVKGISYKENGNIIVNENREMIGDLNKLAFPAFELLDISAYKSFIPDDENIKKGEGIFWKDGLGKEIMAGLIFGRGCPFNCIFCSIEALWGRRVRMPSPKNAFKQVKYYYDKGVRHFAFQDDHLITNKKWFYEFCDLVESLPEPIRYFFNSRIDSANKEVIDRAYQTGARIIGFGIENLSDNSLKLMNKKTTAKMVWDTLALLENYNIQVRGGILINTPGETLEDIAYNIRQHKRMRKYLFQSGTVSALQIYPGTQLELEAKKRGQLENFSWVKPYFSKDNYILSTRPHMPLYVNLPFRKIMARIIKESIKCYDSWLVRTLIREHFVRLMDRDKRNFFNKLRERLMVLKGVFLGIFSWPIKKVFSRFVLILKVIRR